MQLKKLLWPLALCMVLSGCGEATYIGVMIDNHEVAREYQRGLEKAVFVEEQLVEGFLTRFIAVFDMSDLPASVGPVRSVRPYFIDGTAPLLPAIYHAGGSPEALEKLGASSTVTSFNALLLDKYFDYDKVAPAPHHRFITKANIVELFMRLKNPKAVKLPFRYSNGFHADEAAVTLAINHHNPVQNVTYTYDAWTGAYDKMNNGEARPPSPRNILILETVVEVVGPLGRLSVDLEGKGKALLFRNGGVQHGTWRKTGEKEFFTFTDADGKTMTFRDGQIWMIVLDSLDRVTWKNE